MSRADGCGRVYPGYKMGRGVRVENAERIAFLSQLSFGSSSLYHHPILPLTQSPALAATVANI